MFPTSTSRSGTRGLNGNSRSRTWSRTECWGLTRPWWEPVLQMRIHSAGNSSGDFIRQKLPRGTELNQAAKIGCMILMQGSESSRRIPGGHQDYPPQWELHEEVPDQRGDHHQLPVGGSEGDGDPCCPPGGTEGCPGPLVSPSSHLWGQQQLRRRLRRPGKKVSLDN